MIKKLFSISEKDVQLLENIRENNQFLESDSAAVRYVFQEYNRLKEVEENMKEIKTAIAIIKSIENIDRNLLDAINTMLIVSQQEVCYPVSYHESPVITKAKEYEKERLSKLKQKKDYSVKKE